VQEIAEDLRPVAAYYGVDRLEEMCKRLKFGYVVVRESTFAQVRLAQLELEGAMTGLGLSSSFAWCDAFRTLPC
jgi:hypothetical protein